ncbi:MAG: hypothetical protein VB120_00210 [Lachnospiraceae bacterium]|nr:hypothetical protein [Lachnospiraceae bacterium]
MPNKKGVFIPNSYLNSKPCLYLPKSVERNMLPHAMPEEVSKSKAFFSIPKNKSNQRISIIVDETDELKFYNLRG